MLGRIVFASALLVSGSCLAQSNVGDLIKQGGTKMTKEELQALHAGGVTMKGALQNGSPYSQLNKPDGTVAGTAGKFALVGTWKIDDAGRYCHDVGATGRGGQNFSNCNFIYKAGAKYYAAPTEASDAAVREREFVK